ncbi:rhombosortase [Kangiella sp. TOML190]|uniref:rhombosortase n=1 Tax=Kangiella sp. TOML190 TaxID=2931351 RepID=UPI00203D9D6A|nr:rhombosortase [Kangiella sp. TOML190]
MLEFIKRYRVPGVISILVLALLSLEPLSTQWFAYQRQAVGDGQIWRFLSANLVHLSLWHTLMNLASLWLISLIFRPLLSVIDWVLWFIFLYLANTLGMHFWLPELYQYVGMSGALYGLIAACCVAELRLGVKLSGLLLLLVGLKIFAPQILGIKSEYDSWLGGFVVEESHIIGYLQGIILGLVWPKTRLNQPGLGELIGAKKADDTAKSD